MGRLFGGGALLLLALFMFVGFLRADIDAGNGAAVIALLITAVLPAAGGVALLLSHFRRGSRSALRKEELRQQTIEAEVLKLAGRHDGKLTVVETVSELAISPEAATTALDALARRGIADFEVTESGVVVYVFHDVRRLGEKQQSKSILE